MANLIEAMRRALPLVEWPWADQAAWSAAVTPGDIFDHGGRAAHWASRTKLTNLQHYGRWLGYLTWTGQLDAEDPPADRVTRDAVRAYHQHLEGLVAPRTRLSMLVGLKVMMQAMAPERKWRWLQDVCNRIQINAQPSKDKRSRMRQTPEIVAAAIGELQRLPCPVTTVKEALAYRDALMLALMATRPLRVKNFTSLELGRHVTRTQPNWLISIPAAETKTEQPIAFDLPEMLLPWFEGYLSEVRILFPQAAQSSMLWLGKDGVLNNQQSVGIRITKLTHRLLGVAINPHLLRDCAASSLANASADMAQAAPALLGHRHRSTTERYYIQADNLAASRKVGHRLETIKAALRDPT
jgi:site-specific recombinase XerC